MFAICIGAATGKCGKCQWLERPCSLDLDAQSVVKKVRRKATSQEELTGAQDGMLSLFVQHRTFRERCRKLKASIREVNDRISVLQDQNLVSNMAMHAQHYPRSLRDSLHKILTLLVAGKQYGLLRLNDNEVALIEDILDQWEAFSKFFL